MYICIACKSVFTEGDVIERVVDQYPYQEGYAKQYGCACPVCGSTEIIPAFQCSRCEEWFPIDEECSPTEEPMCPKCSEKAEEEIAEEEEEQKRMAAEAYIDGLKDDYLMGDYPYKGVSDPFKLFDRMIEV